MKITDIDGVKGKLSPGTPSFRAVMKALGYRDEEEFIEVLRGRGMLG